MDQQHKQKAPLLVTVSETTDDADDVLLQPQTDMSISSQIHVSVPYVHDKQGELIPELKSVEERVPVDSNGQMAAEDIETEDVEGASSKIGEEVKQRLLETKEADTDLLASICEEKAKQLGTKQEDSQSVHMPETSLAQESVADVHVQVAIQYYYMYQGNGVTLLHCSSYT